MCYRGTHEFHALLLSLNAAPAPGARPWCVTDVHGPRSVDSYHAELSGRRVIRGAVTANRQYESSPPVVPEDA